MTNTREYSSVIENVQNARRDLAHKKGALVWRKIVADLDTPVGVASKLMRKGRGDFLLESVEGGETRGRYSLLGLAPDLMFRVSGNRAQINRNYAQDPAAFTDCEMEALPALRALEQECRTDIPAGLPPALSCLVGYFGYETIGLVEDLPRAQASELDLPDMLFVRPTLILVFDALTDDLFMIAPLWPTEAPIEDAIHSAQMRIDAALDAIQHGPRPAAQHMANDLAPADMKLHPAREAHEYEAMIARAKDYIEAGDIFQVVLAQRFTCPFPLPPFDLYRALRRINPSPFLYFFDFPGFAIVGSSPEILVRVRGGEVTIRPIAGTRPRGKTPAEDIANEASLLADPKERAEHLMLLDLGRNDVGRVADPSTVKVTASYTIERYSHVMHIVSNVTGRLCKEHDAIDALFAGFPAGTVSGAPKVRACQIIAELEPEARGPYAGGVGYFAPDGAIDSCIVLRTGIIKDGVLHVQAGAGIVADSDPAYEQRECEAKAGALLAAAKEALRIARDAGHQS